MSHQMRGPLVPAHVPSGSASESPVPESSGVESDYVMAGTRARRAPALETVMENHAAYARAFNMGQVGVGKVEFRWRRMVLTTLFRQLWRSKDMILSIRAANEGQRVDCGCSHPKEAWRKGGNRYGQYTHCVMCKTRIEYAKFPKPLVGKKSQREAASAAQETKSGPPCDPPKFTKKDKAAVEAAAQSPQRQNQEMIQTVAQAMSAPTTQLVEVITASAQQSASSSETITQMPTMSMQQQQQASSAQQQASASLNQTLTQQVGQQSEVLQVIRQQEGLDHKEKKGSQ